MYSRDGMIMLMNHEVVAMLVLVALIQRLELFYGYSGFRAGPQHL